jgi:electron transport complex protein RnfG
MIKAITSVFFLALGASVLLSTTYHYTHSKITENKSLHQNQMLRKLLTDHEIEIPKATTSTNLDCSDWIVRKVSLPGYSGEIESLALIQFREDGAAVSLRIIDHQETPGIGDFIDHRKNPWIKKSDSQLKQEWATLDLVSGATITSKAVQKLAAKSLASNGGQCVLLD